MTNYNNQQLTIKYYAKLLTLIGNNGGYTTIGELNGKSNK